MHGALSQSRRLSGASILRLVEVSRILGTKAAGLALAVLPSGSSLTRWPVAAGLLTQFGASLARGGRHNHVVEVGLSLRSTRVHHAVASCRVLIARGKLLLDAHLRAG